jgi:AcrR family transcriptional regulator
LYFSAAQPPRSRDGRLSAQITDASVRFQIRSLYHCAVVADVTSHPATSGAHGRPLRARGHRTRSRLLASGATVFAEKGFHAARVDDIVRAAKSSHGTFYLYFVSKEDLFDQLIDEVTQDIAALVNDLPKVTNSDKGRAALRDWLDQFADLYERSGAVIRTWTEAELSGEGVGRKGADAIGSLAETLMTRIKIPKRSGLDPVLAMLALTTMCERFNYYATTRQVKVTRDELLTTLVDIADAAIFGP